MSRAILGPLCENKLSKTECKEILSQMTWYDLEDITIKLKIKGISMI